MVLVTGGTGLVGSHLLFHLLQTQKEIRAIHRKDSDLDRVKIVFSYYSDEAEKLFQKIQWIEADILDLPALEVAFKGVSHVYHCAALISFDPRDFELLKRVNKVGTENIVNLCVDKNIKKLCYASSIAAIGSGIANTDLITENQEWQDEHASVYALSKHLAELEVWRGSQEGLSTVIVNPGIILGPGFWHSGSGVLFKMAAGGPRFSPPGGTGFVTVNDVASMMIQLMYSDIQGERFIAVDKNLTYKEVFSNIAREFGKPVPTSVFKFWQLEILWRLDWLRCFLTGKKRKLTQKNALSMRIRDAFSNEKVRKALGFEFELMAEHIYFCCNRFKEAYPARFS